MISESTSDRALRWLGLAATLSLASGVAPFVHGQGGTGFMVAWQDNVTNALPANGRLPAWMVTANASQSLRRELPDGNAIVLGGAVEGDACVDYRGLNSACAGPDVAFQHKFGFGAYVPVVRLDASFKGIAASEPDRAGWSFAAGMEFGKRFTEAVRLDLRGEWFHSTARADILSRSTGCLVAGLACDFTPRWRLSGRIGWSDGDVISYARAQWTGWGWRPAGEANYDYEGTTAPSMLVGTFKTPYLAYRIHAQTWSCGTALCPAVGRNTSLVFSVEFSETRKDELSYCNRTASVGIVRRF